MAGGRLVNSFPFYPANILDPYPYLDGRLGQHFKITPPLPSKTRDRKEGKSDTEREKEKLAISIRKDKAALPTPLALVHFSFFPLNLFQHVQKG